MRFKLLLAASLISLVGCGKIHNETVVCVFEAERDENGDRELNCGDLGMGEQSAGSLLEETEFQRGD